MSRTSKAIETGDGHQMPSWREVFLYFLFLGIVNAGGPVAQITMMFNRGSCRLKKPLPEASVK